MRHWPIQKGQIEIGIKNLIFDMQQGLEKTFKFECVQTWTIINSTISFRDLKNSTFSKYI